MIGAFPHGEGEGEGRREMGKEGKSVKFAIEMLRGRGKAMCNTMYEQRQRSNAKLKKAFK